METDFKNFFLKNNATTELLVLPVPTCYQISGKKNNKYYNNCFRSSLHFILPILPKMWKTWASNCNLVHMRSETESPYGMGILVEGYSRFCRALTHSASDLIGIPAVTCSVQAPHSWELILTLWIINRCGMQHNGGKAL